jgi:DNA-binding transcriptional LysR family regulator
MIPFVEAIRHRAPEVRLATLPLIIAGLTERLMRGEVDLAVTIPELSDRYLPSRLLYREEYIGIVRKQHPMTRTQPGMEEFCRYDHLLVSSAGGSFTGPTHDALRQHDVSRHVAVSISSFHVLLDLMRVENLVALVPRHMPRGKHDDFRMFRPPVRVAGIHVIACWHPRLSRHPAHVGMREQLARVAQGMVRDRKSQPLPEPDPPS